MKEKKQKRMKRKEKRKMINYYPDFCGKSFKLVHMCNQIRNVQSHCAGDNGLNVFTCVIRLEMFRITVEQIMVKCMNMYNQIRDVQSNCSRDNGLNDTMYNQIKDVQSHCAVGNGLNVSLCMIT